MAVVRAAFLDFDTLGPGDLDLSGLETLLPGIRLYPTTAPAALPDRLAGLDIVLVNKVDLDRATLAAASGLKLVCLAATGTDNVDLKAARELGIGVCNIRDYCGPSVVQHVFGLILSLTLRLPEYTALVRRGEWASSTTFCRLDFPVRELAGLTLGIVGYGSLGRAVARVGRAFGMSVVASRRARQNGSGGEAGDEGEVTRLPLPALLAAADVVSLHCPLTPATRGLIDAVALRTMGPATILINTARGGLVDSAALARALREGWIAGAGIDVLAEEPPVAGDPLLDPTLPNLIVTPHIAWAAREARQRALDEVVANVTDFLAGGRRNRVA